MRGTRSPIEMSQAVVLIDPCSWPGVAATQSSPASMIGEARNSLVLRIMIASLWTGPLACKPLCYSVLGGSRGICLAPAGSGSPCSETGPEEVGRCPGGVAFVAALGRAELHAGMQLHVEAVQKTSSEMEDAIPSRDPGTVC